MSTFPYRGYNIIVTQSLGDYHTHVLRRGGQIVKSFAPDGFCSTKQCRAAAESWVDTDGWQRDRDAADRLLVDLAQAEAKALDALARYKFQMFGYWAAIWVHLNRVGGFKRPNPFREIVKQAKRSKDDKA